MSGLNSISQMEFSTQALEWNVDSRAEEATAWYQSPASHPCHSGLQPALAATPQNSLTVFC